MRGASVRGYLMRTLDTALGHVVTGHHLGALEVPYESRSLGRNLCYFQEGVCPL